MEKQRVNDTVVQLGNLIVKARVHVAHRLSSKIRALRAKKDEKFGKRIERLLLEIAYLKTLSKSGTRKAVARKMLLNTDDAAAKIERETTSPEERAFCRLCKTKFVESFISKFREENVDWKYWVPPLLAMWEKKVEMKKTRILKPESSEEPKRLSVREIAEARKRKMDPDDTRDGGDDRKRAKRVKEVRDRKPTKNEERTKRANNRFNVEPIVKARDRQEVDGATDSEDPADDGETGRGTLSREDELGAEESTSPTEDAEGNESSSSPEPDRKPFRPYAPKHFVGACESDESVSEDDDGVENGRNIDHVSEDDERAGGENGTETQDEESQNNCEDDDGEERTSEDDSEDEGNEDEDSGDDSVEESTPLRKRPVSSAVSVKQLEKVLESDRNEDSDQDGEEEEESSDEEEDDDDSDGGHSEEDESDREREFEERIEKKFKSNGTQKIQKVPVSSYEPESSEEEFPTQEKTNNNARKDGSEEDEDDARASSFFLREGEQPEDVESRTIPKDKAPGLNRRQRRGHEKQRSLASANQDDSDEAEPRSNMAFGKDFRPRRSFQRQDRPQAFERHKPYDRNSAGPRGPPSERFNRNGRFPSGRNPRASLPAKFDRSLDQGGQRRSVNFSKDQRSDSRANRDERRQDSRKEGHPYRMDERFSERPARPSGQPMDRNQGHQRRDSGNAAAHRSRTQDTPRPGAEEKLHPSWLAKKKLSASLNQPFQGKKIVFDD